MSTTAGMYRTEIDGEWHPTLPQWASDDVRLIMAFMDECSTEDCPAALQAEWESVYDRLACLLSPNSIDVIVRP